MVIRVVGLVCLVVLIGPAALLSQTGQYVPELKLFDAKMNGMIAKYQMVGAQLAITYKGRLVYDRGFGYADTADKHLVEPHNIFRLASVSKAITSVAVMKLFESGRLDLDARVLGSDGILNDERFRNAIDSRMYDISVRQLLNHSAGFAYDFANEPVFQTYNIALAMGVPTPTFDFSLVLEWTLQNKTLGSAPGTSAFYSNFGYCLLGLVVQRVTGMRYEDYVRDSVMKPLGIHDFHAGKSLETERYPNEVTYYDYPGAPLAMSIYTGAPNSVPAQYGGYNWEVMTPAGGWVGAAHDLCKLLSALDGLSNRPDILRPSTLDTAFKKSVFWPEYGLGWFVNADENFHTGGIQGTATVIRTNRKQEVSYAILFNALPEKYTPLYLEFMALVSDEFSNVSSWPTHDLFNTTSDVDTDETENFSTTFTIDSPNSFTGLMRVTDLVGRLVLVADVVDTRLSVYTETLPPGVYMLSMTGTDGNVTSNTILRY